jgi:hypothetical protein
VIAARTIIKRRPKFKMQELTSNMLGWKTQLHTMNLSHLHHIDDMVKWVQEAICDHYVITMEPIYENLLHVSIPPSSGYWNIRK